MKPRNELANDYHNRLPEGPFQKSFVHGAFVNGYDAGYQAAELKAKMEFAAKYDHKSPLQVIAAEYVKRRGTTGPLALLEENRFIDGYEAGLHASQSQWISVKDSEPSDETWVLGTNGRDIECVFKHFTDCYSMTTITHWMPMPKPPKE